MARVQLNMAQVALVDDIATLDATFPAGMPDGFAVYAPALHIKGDRGGGTFYYDDDDTTSADDDGATCVVDGSNRRFMRDTSGEDFLRASFFGIHPSNTGTLNASRINDAIEYANSFSDANQLRSTKLMLEQDWTYKIGAQIVLMGFTGIMGGPGKSPGATLLQDADFSAIGPMVTMPTASTGTQRYTEFSNIFIRSTSPTTFYGYIEMKGTNGARIHNFEGRGGCLYEGVKIDATNNRISFRDSYIKQCLNADYSALTATGALRIEGTDHYVQEVLCQVGDTATGSSYAAGGKKAGIWASGGANRFINCRGELSEIGFIGDRLRQSLVSGCTFDLNQGGGMRLTNGCLDLNIRDIIMYGDARASADNVGEHDGIYVTPDTERGININGILVSQSSSYDKKFLRYGVYMPTRNPDVALYPHSAGVGVNRASPNYNTVSNVFGGQWKLGAIGA